MTGKLFADPMSEAFEAFHRENPKVYAMFKTFTYQAINAGRKRFGARMIWQRMRWHTTIEANDPKFKLNNNHTPYYARMFMRDHPWYDGIFETRRAQADEES